MNFDKHFQAAERQVRSQMRWQKLQLIGTGIWRLGLLTAAGALIFLLGRYMQTW